MNMPVENKVDILGVKVDRLTYGNFVKLISNSILKNEQIAIAYANAHTLRKCNDDKQLAELLNSMDHIHPDGMGVFKASRILHGKNALPERITGSDFYPLLAEECVRRNWKVYFFGHRFENLMKIPAKNPKLEIAGISEGYDFNCNDVIGKINESGADILIIGLSFPLQEKWIAENRSFLKCKVILAVGDGIRIFSGEKRRGPEMLRKLGLEWFARLMMNPVKEFDRYVVGNLKFGIGVLSQLLKGT